MSCKTCTASLACPSAATHGIDEAGLCHVNPAPPPPFSYCPALPAAHRECEWDRVGADWAQLVERRDLCGRAVLCVPPAVLTGIASEAFRRVNHLFRASHLEQLRSVFYDEEASDNDRFVALDLLRNAKIAAEMVLPSCQDTGTAIILGHKGQYVWTDDAVDDEEALSRGVYETYVGTNLRYSQMAPVTMFTETNTRTNLPAQVDLLACKGSEYHFLFMAKGGGSANKTFLFQKTQALLNREALKAFVSENLMTLGTAACPPYHLALVVGGTSPEMNLKTVKLASARELDSLPTKGNGSGSGYRDTDFEKEVLEICRASGIGAQFGGKYFAHDVRVIRLPRHGASCFVGLGVSCSADRQIKGKITAEGVFLERLERNVDAYFPEPGVVERILASQAPSLDLTRPLRETLAALSKLTVGQRVVLNGPIIVARDIAHARLKANFERTGQFPEYFKQHIIYYAGPAKKPEGLPSGSFGPTTAGRMDAYVEQFMSHGASMVTLAKGNRSKSVTDACQKYGGFYLGPLPVTPSAPTTPPGPALKEPRLQFMSAHDKYCDNEIGWGLLERIRNTHKARAVTCHEHKWLHSRYDTGSYCDMRNVALDGSRMRAGLKSGWAGEEGHLTYSAGALKIAGCSQKPSFAGVPLFGPLAELMRVGAEGVDALPHKCEWVEEPVVVLTRNEWAHMLFSVCEATNAFIGARALLGGEDSKVRVLLLDTHPMGPFGDFYTAVSRGGDVIRGADLVDSAKTLCFRRLITSVHGYTSFLVSEATGEASKCRHSPLLRDWRNLVLSKLGMLDVEYPRVPSALLISRRPYKHEGFDKKKIGRVIRNEPELETAMQEYTNAGRLRFQIVDLATLSLKEQIHRVRGSNILVGMHGAGLVHALFLPDDAAVIEIFPRGYGENHRDRNVARHMGHVYVSYELPSTEGDRVTIDIPQFKSVLNNVVHIAAGSFGGEAKRCGLSCP
eukprot:m51a1_g11794 putative fumarate hydratase (961) ;mRNA; f:313758-317679